MYKATPVYWAGDPVETGRFTQLRGERNYEEMLGHFKDYGDIIGDHPVNLLATMLALNAYMLGQERSTRSGLLEYVDAWLQRTLEKDGIIPSNVGLDGKIGGGAGGWGFSVKWPQTGDKIHHLNNSRLAIAGFGNAFLLTGDPRYLDVWRQMIHKVNAQARVIGGVRTYPHSYGDQGRYNYTPNLNAPGAFDLWYWTMKPEDRRLLELEATEIELLSTRAVFREIPEAGWMRFLVGLNPKYPEETLRQDLDAIRQRVKGMRSDPTTPDTRLSEGPMKYNLALARNLTQLMLGGRRTAPVLRAAILRPSPAAARSPRGGRRAGGEGEKPGGRGHPRQPKPHSGPSAGAPGGCLAEHQLVSAVIGERRFPIGRSWMALRLEPGCGSRIVLELRRHVNQPTLALPLGSHVEHAEKPDEPERPVERFWDGIFRNPTLFASCCR